MPDAFEMFSRCAVRQWWGLEPGQRDLIERLSARKVVPGCEYPTGHDREIPLWMAGPLVVLSIKEPYE